MSQSDVSAAALFRQFAPKFREVSWESCGMHKHEAHDSFFFAPDISSGYTYYEVFHSINVRKAKLEFSIAYKHTKKGSLREQMRDACWQAILEGPFKGRSFYMDPKEEDIAPHFESDWNQQIGMQFSHDGEEIPGLHLVQNMSAPHWNYFVPSESPEGEAIKAAIMLEAHQKREERLAGEVSELPSVTEVQEHFNEKLAAVQA